MDKIEKTKKKKLVFDGKVVKLYADEIICPDGKESIREYIAHPGGAAILALDENNNVFLVEQYRYAYKETLLEIPAGKLEYGEDPAEAAARELEEETGYKCDHIIHLGDIYPSCGYSAEIIHIYLAKNLIKTHQHLDTDEFLNVKKVSFDEFVNLINTNQIKDAKSVAALQYYLALQK